MVRIEQKLYHCKIQALLHSMNSMHLAMNIHQNASISVYHIKNNIVNSYINIKKLSNHHDKKEAQLETMLL
jgi:hypothetical protein